ncbi:MAG: esterase [Rhodothermia bacterium]|nr:MAG: esterase [Rhodothermia bacterium]
MKHPTPSPHHISVSRTARYFTVGEIRPDVTEVWFGLHGYGQTALEFVQPFRAHYREDRLVISPEALSRFYRRNRDHEIGASWMTSEDRKVEIRDYVDYLNRLYEGLVEQGINKDASVVVLGFSQGAATASRWLASGTVFASRLILWGGLPAFELCDENFQTSVSAVSTTLVTGTSDQYMPPDRAKEVASLISIDDRPVKTLIYDGPHEINPAMLTQLMGEDLGKSVSDNMADILSDDEA